MKQKSRENSTTEQKEKNVPEKKVLRISVRNLVEFLLRSGDLQGAREGFADREAMQEGSRIHRRLQKQRRAGYQAEVPLSYEKEYEKFTLIVEGRADGIYHGSGWADFSGAEFCGRENDTTVQASGAVQNSSLSAAAAQDIAVQAETEQGGTVQTAAPRHRRKPRTGAKAITIVEEIKGISQDPSHLTRPVPVHLAQAKCYAYIYANQCHLKNIGVRMTYCNLETEETKYFYEDGTIKIIYADGTIFTTP